MKAPRHVKCVLCGREFVKPIQHRCRMGMLRHYRKAARIRGLETIFKPIGGTMNLSILIHFADFRGDHSADGCIAHEYIPGETIEDLVKRTQMNSFCERIEIRMVKEADHVNA